jgi:signal transduction histidine kinase
VGRHYGLAGMRERATLVGGKLTIWSEVDAGTEVEVRLPGEVAYLTPRRPFWRPRRIFRNAKA